MFDGEKLTPCRLVWGELEGDDKADPTHWREVLLCLRRMPGQFWDKKYRLMGWLNHAGLPLYVAVVDYIRGIGSEALPDEYDGFSTHENR